jgi:hypothetical protein
MKLLHVITSFIVNLSAAFIVVVIVMLLINQSKKNEQDNKLFGLLLSISRQFSDISNIQSIIIQRQENISIAFNETSIINATITDYYNFLDNYTCQQIERINNITPPCNGTFFINGIGNVTVNSAINGIVVNGTLYQVQMDQDQTLINFIMSTLSIINMDLAVLNMEAIKSINNVTVDANGNINLVGECGVDIYVNNTIGITIDTCRIQNNATALVIQLNETYYSILNQTNQVNVTLISLSQILVILELQVNLLQSKIVKNINGILPDSQHNINLNAGPYISIIDPNPGNITIKNDGIFTVNNINVARSVTILPGTGITVTTTAPDIIEISNTNANIFAEPCTVSAVSTSATTDYLYPNNNLNVANWTPFGANTKTFPSCPDVFNLTQFIQPEGIWTLRLEMQIGGRLNGGACALCSYTLGYGFQRTNTSSYQMFQMYYPVFRLSAGTATFGLGAQPVYIVGEIIMDGNIIPPGTTFDAIAYYYNYDTSGLPDLLIAFSVQAIYATRIG